ncbi:MAG: LAGLIDADG family homing endonuclease [bacterium]|nr:LAGLIDADG family homing endonuclease [bacterium]
MTWQYIAGFFDGEGSIVHNGKGFRITIAQANLEVLIDIKKFSKIGNVFKVRKRQAHWKDSWVYYVAKQEDVLTFLKNTLGFLVVKKRLALATKPKVTSTVRRIAKRRNIQERRMILANKLRAGGMTYRTIGKKLGIDFGYARRLILKNGAHSSIG